MVDSPVDPQVDPLGLAGFFLPLLKIENLVFKSEFKFLKTSLGLIWVIRTPIFENSDSISRIFPDEHNGAARFPIFLYLKLIILSFVNISIN